METKAKIKTIQEFGLEHLEHAVNKFLATLKHTQVSDIKYIYTIYPDGHGGSTRVEYVAFIFYYESADKESNG